VSVKTNPKSKVRYGWIVGRGDSVPHEEQPLNDTDSRRFEVEYQDTGTVTMVDARSLRKWTTTELPIFRIKELEALDAERKQLDQRGRPSTTKQSPQRTPASQGHPRANPQTPPPAEAAAQQQEEREIPQPEIEVEHREPAQEQRAPARIPRAPARESAQRTGVMDKSNYSNYHTDNIIGDINAGRSTRSRPNGAATLTAHGAMGRMSPFKMLGKGLWEIVRMARTLDGMANRENELQETNHDKGDNQDSLEPDLTQSDRRQNAFVNNPPNTQ
jgi:hypothetical protein